MIELLTQNKENPEVSGELMPILLSLSEASPNAAEKLGSRDFIKMLIRDTKNNFKLGSEDPEAAKRAEQNLKCLQKLAKNPENTTKILEEGGADICANIISKKAREGGISGASEEDVQNAEVNLIPDDDEEAPGYVDDSDDVAQASVEMMNEILQDKEAAAKYLTTNDIRSALALLSKTNDANTCDNLFDLIEKAADDKSLSEFMADNGGMDQIMAVCNRFPNRKNLQKKAGEIFKKMGANEYIPGVTDQLQELTEGFKADDEDSRQALNSCALYLGNLMNTEKSAEAEGDSDDKIIKCLEKTLPHSLDDPQLAASQLLLLQKMANRDPETAKKIRESSLGDLISKQILGMLENVPENVKINQIILDSAESLNTRFPKNAPSVIDGKTGDEIKAKKPEDQYAKNVASNEEAIKEMTSILEQAANQEEGSPNKVNKDVLESAIGVLENLARCSDDCVDAINKRNGARNAAKLLNSTSPTEGTTYQHKLLGLISQLGQNKDGYNDICEENGIEAATSVVEKIPMEALEDPDCQTLKNMNAALRLLGDLADNDWDHSKFIDANSHKPCLEILDTIQEAGTEAFVEADYLNEIVKNSMRALKRMARDPALARAIMKSGGDKTGKTILGRMSGATGKNPHEEVDPEALAKLEGDLNGAKDPLC
mmetsp:Transcript_15296/g.12989  ORF Transcript_15296/g.12989 Transcript_15296/m.12989 type:complete len:658 (+) Transcript_15296:1683-3656(+)